jgi:hypothetical protein
MMIKYVFNLGPRPEFQTMPSLYNLMQEAPVVVVDKNLSWDPEKCMNVLIDLEDVGVLVGKFLVALRMWIHWRQAQMVRNCLLVHIVNP